MLESRAIFLPATSIAAVCFAIVMEIFPLVNQVLKYTVSFFSLIFVPNTKTVQLLVMLMFFADVWSKNRRCSALPKPTPGKTEKINNKQRHDKNWSKGCIF